MAKWIDVGPTCAFPDGEHVCTDADEKPVVVLHLDGRFYAIANICPHAGLPLGEGERRGFVLTCPFHGNAYNIKSGRNVDWPHDELPLKTYPVRVEGQTVQVNLDAHSHDDANQ